MLMRRLMMRLSHTKKQRLKFKACMPSKMMLKTMKLIEEGIDVFNLQLWDELSSSKALLFCGGGAKKLIGSNKNCISLQRALRLANETVPTPHGTQPPPTTIYIGIGFVGST
ncbi:unnamed protein product [Prunus armeniaca]